MTETAAPETAETTPESVVEPQTTPPEGDNPGTDTDDALAKLRRENQSLRQRLRAAEQTAEESAGATAALETMLGRIREDQISRLVSDRMADPEDFISRANINELVDEHGAIDTTKVETAITELLDRHPHYARQADAPKPPPSNRPIENLRAGASPTPEPTSTNWHDALRSTMR